MRRKNVEIFIVKGASHRRCIQRFIRILKPNHAVEVQRCENADMSILVTIQFNTEKSSCNFKEHNFFLFLPQA